MNLKLLLENVLDRATLSASPALVSTLPATNLQISRRDALARSTSAADQTILAVWSAAQVIDSLCLWGHNLTIHGTWRVRLYASADGTGTPLYDSGAAPALPRKALGELRWGVDPLGAVWTSAGGTPHAALWLSAPVLGVFSARLELSDATHPAGYLEAQRLYLGQAFCPTVNLNWGAELSYQDESTFIRSARGSLFVESGPRYRQLSLTLDELSDAEVMQLGAAVSAAGKAADALVAVYPDAPVSRRGQYTLAARLSELPRFTHTRIHTSSTTLAFTEI